VIGKLRMRVEPAGIPHAGERSLLTECLNANHLKQWTRAESIPRTAVVLAIFGLKGGYGYLAALSFASTHSSGHRVVHFEFGAFVLFSTTLSSSLGSFVQNHSFSPHKLDVVVKPRQPLCDLNPFDSVFLIIRRNPAGCVATSVVPTLLRELPRGQNLSDMPFTTFAEAYSRSVKVPQRWHRNERSH